MGRRQGIGQTTVPVQERRTAFVLQLVLPSTNGAAFGIDYLNRTAAAKANIFVNKPNETKILPGFGRRGAQRLNGGKKFHVVTFPKGQLPPVKGFWSLTLYNGTIFLHRTKSIAIP